MTMMLRLPGLLKSRYIVIALLSCSVMILAAVVPGCQPRNVQFFQNPYRGYTNWYKGAIHVHTNLSSDGHQSPLVVVQAHRAKGYDFVFLTDHNTLSRSWLRSENDFRGVEDILYFTNFKSFECGDDYAHHILVLGIDLKKVDWYYNNVRNDVDPDRNGTVVWDTGDCENVPARTSYYNHVAVEVLAHPHKSHGDDLPHYQGWSLDESKDSDYCGIEIYNSSESENDNVSFCTDWWDEILKLNKVVWGFGGDDCHNVFGNMKSFNRSWIVVNSNRSLRTEPAKQIERDIIENIKEGNFYTVVRSPDRGATYKGLTPSDGPDDYGPTLQITTYAHTIRVSTDEDLVSSIYFVHCSDLGIVSREGPYQGPSASFYPPSTDRYVRIEVEQTRSDGELYRAYSQPLSLVKAQPQ